MKGTVFKEACGVPNFLVGPGRSHFSELFQSEDCRALIWHPKFGALPTQVQPLGFLTKKVLDQVNHISIGIHDHHGAYRERSFLPFDFVTCHTHRFHHNVNSKSRARGQSSEPITRYFFTSRHHCHSLGHFCTRQDFTAALAGDLNLLACYLFFFALLVTSSPKLFQYIPSAKT